MKGRTIQKQPAVHEKCLTRGVSRDLLHAPRSTLHIQRAFTFVELIVVVVILSILAVVVVSRFIDAAPDARLSATKGVAGALTAASANNYAIRKANASKGSAVTNCTNVGTLQSGLLPTGYTITSLAIAANAAVTCTVTHPDTTTTATFTGLGVS